MKNLAHLILFAAVLFLSACEKETLDPESNIDPNQRVFGPFEVLADNETIYMNGEIGSSTLTQFNSLISVYPNISSIDIYECPGSSDDEVNLKLSARVHNLGINTNIVDSGLIASGGVDFFLAGVERTKGSPVWVGVHAWADQSSEATNYPVGHSFHLEYINYYKSVGFTQQQAEDFYYFTINAANSNSIHWMTDPELDLYNVFTE